jgi:hypothetical protein
MRSLISSYLAVGFVLLLIGLFGTGACANKNTDMLSDLIFVLGWPGYLYKDVINGPMTTTQLLHKQACAGGVVVLPPATLH